MSFAENLKYLMEQRSLTNYQLAKIIGCHQTTIANWLSGDTMPQKRTLKSLSDKLGVSVAFLLGEATTQDGVIFSDGTGYGGGFATGAGFEDGTGYGGPITLTKKEKPVPNGNGLSEEVIQIARELEAAAPEVRNMVKAVLESSYKPESGVKVFDVLCPLTGRTEQIRQPYYIYNGKRLPEQNNGCDQCHKCEECELCQMRVMRMVMEG